MQLFQHSFAIITDPRSYIMHIRNTDACIPAQKAEIVLLFVYVHTWEDVSKAIAGPVLRNLSHFIVKLRIPVYILHIIEYQYKVHIFTFL